MTYNFKAAEEFAWAVFVAIVVTIATALITFEPEEIADWEAWAVGLIAGTVRAAAAAVLAQIRPGS